jgi:hypothetical protein
MSDADHFKDGDAGTEVFLRFSCNEYSRHRKRTCGVES